MELLIPQPAHDIAISGFLNVYFFSEISPSPASLLLIGNGQKEHIVNYNALLHEYNTEIIISRYNLPYINTIYKKMVKKIVSRIIENHIPTNSLSVIRKKNVFKGSNLLDKLLFIISLSIVLVLIFFIASKINHTDLSNFPIR